MPLSRWAGQRVHRKPSIGLDLDLDLLAAHAAGGFQEQRQPDATQPSGLLCRPPPLLERLPLRLVQGRVQQSRRIGAVVSRARRCLERKLAGLEQIAPAQLDRIDAELLRGLFDQTLPQVRDVRTAGAAVRGRWRRVGEHQPVPAINRGHVVQADRGRGRRRHGVDESARTGAIGSKIDQPLDAQAEDPARRIERQLSGQVGGPGMMIARYRFRARSGPLDRPAGLLRRQHQCRELRIDFVPDAKAATDVDRMNDEAAAIEPGDLRQRRLEIRRALARHANLERVRRSVVSRDAGFRLHRIAGDALRAQIDPHDMRGFGKRAFRLLLIAVDVVQRQIVRARRRARRPPDRIPHRTLRR